MHYTHKHAMLTNTRTVPDIPHGVLFNGRKKEDKWATYQLICQYNSWRRRDREHYSDGRQTTITILTTSGQCKCLISLEREMSNKCLVDMARLRFEFNYLNSVCPWEGVSSEGKERESLPGTSWHRPKLPARSIWDSFSASFIMCPPN